MFKIIFPDDSGYRHPTHFVKTGMSTVNLGVIEVTKNRFIVNRFLELIRRN